MAVYQRWIDRIAAEVVDATADHNDPDNLFRSGIIGAAVMGMVDSVTRQWILSPHDIKFVDLYDQGFALLAPLLDDPDARRLTLTSRTMTIRVGLAAVPGA